jgi:putative RNA 2'-phosphotransferase
MDQETLALSKFISLVLRHRPDIISLDMDEQGWCDVNQLIDNMNKDGKTISYEKLNEIVETDNKQRYSFNEDQTKIRANQGHSIQVDLKLKCVVPPQFLYHGTVEKFINSIMHSGLQKKERQFVHLSADFNTAEIVAKRRGEPIILKILSGRMFEEGYQFFKSENEVWLVDHVPIRYIERV